MKKAWIVVANSSVAKIYHAESSKKLVLDKTLEHPESRLHEQDLVSDKPGISTSSVGYGIHTEEVKTPATVQEKVHFAEEIALLLQKGYQEKEFEHLYLIASPIFLGHLRHSLSATVNEAIQSEIHKDLTKQTPEEILTYLPPVL